MKPLMKTEDAEIGAVAGDQLPPGTELSNGQYVIEKHLNSGGFGVTYLAMDSLGRRIVIKECFPNAMCCRAGDLVRLRSHSFEDDFERVVELFEKEARALARLQHPNIVGVHSIFQDNGTAYMALDFVDGLDLLDVLHVSPDVLGPKEIRRFLTTLLQALRYVHAAGILHRDISPDNILLDNDGTPVLIDFGAARQDATKASRILSRVHTVKDGYSPQEFYFAGSAQMPASDLYALAATFYHLITGHAPPNSNLRLACVAENRPDPYVPLSGKYPEHDSRILGTIDTCMALFAKDRIQSAESWLDILTSNERAARTARNDKDIDLTIRELVQATRQAMEQDAAMAAEIPEEDIAPKLSPEEIKRQKEREYWAILNEDPSDWDGNQDERGRSTAASAPQHVSSSTRGSGTKSRSPFTRLSLSRLFSWGSRDHHTNEHENTYQ